MPLTLFTRWKVKTPGLSLEYAGGEDDQFTDDIAAADQPVLGHYVQNIFEMKNFGGAFTARERGLFGIHYINTTGGDLDTTWITADFTAVESAIQTFWTAMAGYIFTGVRLVEHRWYRFGPGVMKPNPPVRSTVIGTPIPGTSSSGTAYQVAQTFTLRTALRRHWGRFYLPIGTSALSAPGQWPSSTVDSWAALVKTMFNTPQTSQGITPCVYDRVRKQALGVIAVEADSVPDIVRRRRPRDTGYKAILTS